MEAPTLPIPFHRLLKIVAVVDAGDPQVRELLDRLTAENYEVEVTDRFERDVTEDAAVGAYIACVDGERRERARNMARAVRAAGFATPLWALADSSRIADVQGRTWVTRTGVHIDRIASAWLIRRFVDPAARFKFVPARGYGSEPDELRFDMFDAEFTHDGDLCTFEVLLRDFDLADPALRALGEIVHDV